MTGRDSTHLELPEVLLLSRVSNDCTPDGQIESRLLRVGLSPYVSPWFNSHPANKAPEQVAKLPSIGMDVTAFEAALGEPALVLIHVLGG